MSVSAAPFRGGNLPAELTSFVGRRREMAELKRMLGVSRLVTLTGVGGAGKTRLAVRAAAANARFHTDGVWFADLAELEDGTLLVQTIMSALGLHDRRSGEAANILEDFLADKDLLLVLDNCDHLRDECGILAEALLRRAPGLQILGTSRHTLGVTGEHVFQVPPLAVPEDVATIEPDAVAHYEALNLFVERAQAVSPSFRLTESTVRATAAICQRLDGIPLAIELAAARLRAMSVHDLLDRLDDRFQVLVGGSPSALPRHRTLRELIGWSWDLCSDEQRSVWARTAVLSSSFDLAAAEAICAWEPLDRSAVLDAVSALVDKSILIAQDHGGRVRYRMLETIRQYGLEQLDAAGQTSEMRERHRAHYAAVARDAGKGWFSDQQATLLSQLRVEQNHLRVALDTSFETAALVDSGLDLVSDLWFFWIATGQTHEARGWLERGLGAGSAPSSSRTRAMVMCAYLCVQQEDLDTAAPLIEEALRSAARDRDSTNQAWAVQVQGMVALCGGDLAGAEQFFDDALEAHRVSQDVPGVVDAIFFLAALCALRGDLVRAEALYREAVITCESHGENWTKGYLLWGLGLVAWQGGDADRATAHVRSALRIGRYLNELWAIAFCLEFLAWTSCSVGEYDRAAQLLGGARELWRRVGWRHAGVPLYYGMRELTHYHDECVTQLGERLGPEKLEGVLLRGAALTLEELIFQALGEPRAKRQERSPSEAGHLPNLTKREREVAHLVSQGLSNRQIAEQLVISPRTVDVHVENILTKLGFTSRAQVAAWVVERRTSRDK
jgi:non-specific serine/threonine protein kinase